MLMITVYTCIICERSTPLLFHLILCDSKICNVIVKWACFQKYEELGFPLTVTYLCGIMKMGKDTLHNYNYTIYCTVG